MPENERVQEVQVSELRKRYKFYLEGKKPIILRKNSQVVGVLFCVESSWYRGVEHSRKEARRLRSELEAVLKQILR